MDVKTFDKLLPVGLWDCSINASTSSSLHVCTTRYKLQCFVLKKPQSAISQYRPHVRSIIYNVYAALTKFRIQIAGCKCDFDYEYLNLLNLYTSYN